MPAKHRNHPLRKQPPERKFGRRGVQSGADQELMLIVCEGKETEKHYFYALKRELGRSAVSIEIVSSAGQTLRLVKHAHEIQQKRKSSRDRPPFDQIWCVFDREANNEAADFQAAVDFADDETKKLKLAISNPCFEYWYLLHFVESDAPYAGGQELKRALGKHIPGYHAALPCYDLLQSYTEQALDRAETLHVRGKDSTGDAYPNPSTTVYKLVRRLLVSG